LLEAKKAPQQIRRPALTKLPEHEAGMKMRIKIRI